MTPDPFLLVLLHLTADFWLQSTWMAVKKHQLWIAAIVHGAVYTAAFLVVTLDWRSLLVIGVTHTLIDRYRLATVIPRFVNWNWDNWSWYGWLNFDSYNPNAQPSYFPVSLHWLNIVADQVLHLWILYLLFY